MRFLHWLFKQPQFDDEDQTLRARLLHVVLLAYLLSTVVFVVLSELAWSTLHMGIGKTAVTTQIET